MRDDVIPVRKRLRKRDLQRGVVNRLETRHRRGLAGLDGVVSDDRGEVVRDDRRIGLTGRRVDGLRVGDPVPCVDEVVSCDGRAVVELVIGIELEGPYGGIGVDGPRRRGGRQNLGRIEIIDRGQAVEERLLDLSTLRLLSVVRVDVGRFTDVVRE